MALKDLKSDLSKFRKPLKTDPIEAQKDARKPKKFVTTPLAERVPPNTYTSPQTPQKVGKDVAGNNPTGRHTKGTDVVNAPSPSGRHTNGTDTVDGKSPSGRHEQSADISAGNSPSGRHETGKEVPEATSPSGRHTVAKEVPDGNSPSGRHEIAKEVPDGGPLSGRHEIGKEVANNVPLSGRLGDGVDVENTSNIQGRHTTGKEVDNGSAISGRHTTGEDVANTSAISGRHTTGKEVDNNSAISGRHETDNSGYNIDGTVPQTNPRGRHEIGKDVENTSIISGRHTEGVDNPNTSAISGRHTNGVDNPNTSPLTGRHDGDDTSQLNYDGTVPLTNPRGRHDSGDTSNKNIDGVPNKYSNTVGEGLHYPNHDGAHSTKDIDGVPTKYSNTINDGIHFNSPDQSIRNIDGIPNKYSDTVNVNGLHGSPHIGAHSNFDRDGNPLNNEVSTNGFIEGVGGLRSNDKFQASRWNTDDKYTNLYNVGQSKIEAQLGEGTFAPGAGQLVGHDVKMIASDVGYNTTRKYSTIVGVSSLSALGHQYIQKNSPSFLDAEYSKFKVRDEAYNPYYIKHPLILRGIQKDGEDGYEPERYGLGGPDGGLIRGGAVTTAQRLALDTARIAKWMASPPGLLWVVKQVGLGLTNPNVETMASAVNPIGNPIIGQTKIHTGLTSLLSVAGTPLGLHFTRHGLPFANEVASYENVIRFTQFSVAGNKNNNRLIKLTNAKDNPLQLIGTPYLAMSGLTGPNSVYGIGLTNHKRYYNSDPLSSGTPLDLAGKAKEIIKNKLSNIKNQYASVLNKDLSAFSNTKNEDKTQTTDEPVGTLQQALESPDEAILPIHKSQTPEEKAVEEMEPFADGWITRRGEKPGRSDSKNLDDSDPDNPIKKYAVLAYGAIPKTFDDRKGDDGSLLGDVHDFRNAVNDEQTSTQGDIASWERNNLRDKYGFGDHGKVGADRSNYKDTSYNDGLTSMDLSKFRGDKVNAIDAHVKGRTAGKKIPFEEIYGLLGESSPPLDRDFIRFYFTGPQQIGKGGDNSSGGGEEEVLVFRSTIGSFTDTFSPSWTATKQLGRADSVHVYNGWGRSISFDFRVQATSRDEMRPLWRKLNYLASWTAPRYASGRMRGPYIRFTLGNLFQETPCFISGLTYTTDGNNTPWEINIDNDEDMLQLPTGVNVSMTLTMLMDYRPQWNGRMYSLSDRGRLEKDSDRLNWLYDSSNEKPNDEEKKG
jgi:hypothetical protein